MRLYLMRHGIAEERDQARAASDARRSLTPRGRARVEAVARGLAALGVAPQEIWSSSLLRARQTADIVARLLGVGVKAVHLTPALSPDADPARLLEVLARRGEGDVLCCGHAPHLDALLSSCLGLGDQPRTALKKAGVACLELAPGVPARLEWLLPPFVLRRVR